MRFKSFYPLMSLMSLWFVLFARTPVHAEKTTYSIQAGTFKEFGYAKNEVDKLTKAGLHVFYRHEDRANREEWFRVYVGKYSSRGEPLREARRLKQHRLITNYAIKILNESEESVSKPFIAKTDYDALCSPRTVSL
jgi:hypothetical protein